MQLGKTFLGDEGMEKVKKGDLSEIMNLGKQFLGEETMNDIITGVADQFIQMKDLKIKTSDKKENTSACASDDICFRSSCCINKCSTARRSSNSSSARVPRILRGNDKPVLPTMSTIRP